MRRETCSVERNDEPTNVTRKTFSKSQRSNSRIMGNKVAHPTKPKAKLSQPENLKSQIINLKCYRASKCFFRFLASIFNALETSDRALIFSAASR